MNGVAPAEQPMPPELLEAISAKAGGRIVLVIGAGASVEPPMELPLADECAEKAHRKLLHDQILEDGDCDKPSDLSCLADAVYEKTGSQVDLVSRLPVERFRTVTPNRGCLIAAALLREGALKSILSLNFDLGMVSALAYIGSENDVTVITKPADHGRMSATNLIYLHRTVDALADEWVLRTEAIANGWQEGWEEVIGNLALGGPVTVFAGLGSPAGVLVETSRRIKAALPDEAKLLQVDPADPERSAMRHQVGLDDEEYLRLGWNEFMSRLAERLLAGHRDELHDACRKMIEREGFDDGDPSGVCDRLTQLDLLGVGELRARWLLETRQRYLPQGAVDVELIASLMLAIALIEHRTGTSASFHDDGVVEFVKDGSLKASLLVASGRGTRGWNSIEAAIGQPAFPRSRRFAEPRYVLLGGVGAREPVAPPMKLVGEEDEAAAAESIIGGEETLILRSVDELRAQPSLAEEMVA